MKKYYGIPKNSEITVQKILNPQMILLLPEECRPAKKPRHRTVSAPPSKKKLVEIGEPFNEETAQQNKQAERIATKIIRNLSATQRSNLLSHERLHLVQSEVEDALRPFEEVKV